MRLIWYLISICVDVSIPMSHLYTSPTLIRMIPITQIEVNPKKKFEKIH